MYYRTIEWKYQNEDLQMLGTSWKYYNFGVVSDTRKNSLSNVLDPFFTYVGQSRQNADGGPQSFRWVSQ